MCIYRYICISVYVYITHFRFLERQLPPPQLCQWSALHLQWHWPTMVKTVKRHRETVEIRSTSLTVSTVGNLTSFVGNLLETVKIFGSYQQIWRPQVSICLLPKIYACFPRLLWILNNENHDYVCAYMSWKYRTHKHCPSSFHWSQPILIPVFVASFTTLKKKVNWNMSPGKERKRSDQTDSLPFFCLSPIPLLWSLKAEPPATQCLATSVTVNPL